MSARENMKGFAVGLSMTGFAVLSSALSTVPQSVCAGSCQSCYACGLTAVPLLLWIASKARKHGAPALRQSPADSSTASAEAKP